MNTLLYIIFCCLKEKISLSSEGLSLEAKNAAMAAAVAAVVSANAGLTNTSSAPSAVTPGPSPPTSTTSGPLNGTLGSSLLNGDMATSVSLGLVPSSAGTVISSASNHLLLANSIASPPKKDPNSSSMRLSPKSPTDMDVRSATSVSSSGENKPISCSKLSVLKSLYVFSQGEHESGIFANCIRISVLHSKSSNGKVQAYEQLICSFLLFLSTINMHSVLN